MSGVCGTDCTTPAFDLLRDAVEFTPEPNEDETA